MINKCPDCGGELEKGCNVDYTYGGVSVQQYAKADIKDVPKKLNLGSISEANFNDLRRVVTYRCVKCNRLYSYAQTTILEKNFNARNIALWLIVALAIIGMIIVLIIFRA